MRDACAFKIAECSLKSFEMVMYFRIICNVGARISDVADVWTTGSVMVPLGN